MPPRVSERLLLLLVVGLTLPVIAGAYLQIASTPIGFEWPNLLLALGLVSTTAASYLFPIHIRHHTKLTMTSVPLYLMVVLLTPPLAACGVLIGVATGNLLTRRERGRLPSDIVISAGRWTLVAYLASLTAHAPAIEQFPSLVVLPVTALVMFLGDLVTSSIQIAPMVEEPPWRVLSATWREAAGAEAIQYLIGMLGVLASSQGVWALVLLALPVAFSYRAFKSTKEIRQSTRQILEEMADAVDQRDPYTGGHSRRVAAISKRILDEMNTPGVEADLIVSAARIHDIGKIKVPEEILLKPGALTPEERQVMQTHVDVGAQFLASYPDFARSAEMIRYHHEFYDGTGYQKRLKGLDIPFGARVLAVADGFDAMTTDRPYRRAMSEDQALAILTAGRSKQWDPHVVDALVRTLTTNAQHLSVAANQIAVKSAT